MKKIDFARGHVVYYMSSCWIWPYIYIYLGSSIEQLQYMIQVASPYSIRERYNTGMQGY